VRPSQPGRAGVVEGGQRARLEGRGVRARRGQPGVAPGDQVAGGSSTGSCPGSQGRGR
jgi:hypothetical protein